MSTLTRQHDWLIVRRLDGKDPDILHRVREWSTDDDHQVGHGSAVCGLTTTWETPGPFQRMGLTRCPDCCDTLGIPHGQGTTTNAGIEEPQP